MKKLNEFTDQELKDAFGDLAAESQDEVRKNGNHAEMDPALENRIHETLSSISEDISAADIADAGSVPASFLSALEGAKAETFAKVAAEEAELDLKNQSVSRARKQKSQRQESFLSRLFRPVGLASLAGVAAVVALGMFALFGPNAGSAGNVVMAPGPETGFADPVFVWKTKVENEVAALEVIDEESGEIIAKMDSARSPMAFSSVSGGKLLSSGHRYQLRLTDGGKTLAERTFSTTSHAVSRGPERESTLDGVIQQCEDFIAAGRPADAWMLWTQLTTDEKSDPRMQELKTLILSKIG